MSSDSSIALASFRDDTVGGDLLAGPHHERVADRQLLGGDAYFDTVAQHGDVLGAQLRSARSAAPDRRLARASK